MTPEQQIEALKKRLAALMLHVNGKLGANPYGVPQYRDALRLLYELERKSAPRMDPHAWMDVDLQAIAARPLDFPERMG